MPNTILMPWLILNLWMIAAVMHPRNRRLAYGVGISALVMGYCLGLWIQS